MKTCLGGINVERRGMTLRKRGKKKRGNGRKLEANVTERAFLKEKRGPFYKRQRKG